MQPVPANFRLRNVQLPAFWVPDAPDGPTDVLVRDGRIQAWGTHDAAADLPAFDAQGAWLTPGFADLATYATEPGYEHRGTLAELADDARAGGYTDLLVQPNLVPILDNEAAVQAFIARAGLLGVRLHPAGALRVGAAGKHMAELYGMYAAGARAFTDGPQGVQDAGLLGLCLQYLQPRGALVLQVPLDLAIAGRGVANESPAMTALGLKPIPYTAEAAAVARDLQVLRQYGGRLHLSPVTTRAAVQLVQGAKAEGLHVSAGTAPYYLLCTDDALADFDSRYKFFPPLRTQADVDALRAAFADGTIDTLDSHHVPVSYEEKQLEFDYAEAGAPTLPLAFAAAWTALSAVGLPLAEVLARLVVRPRQLLGLSVPTLANASLHDLFLVQPTAAPVLPPRQARQTLAFSPFAGLSLQGRVQALTAILAPTPTNPTATG